MRTIIIATALSFLCLISTAQNVGIGTTTPIARLHVADSNVVFTGPATMPESTIYKPPIQGPGVRMMWYPQKAAFRVGAVNGTQWDIDNIGNGSFATGNNTRASGTFSTAIGDNTLASGNYSIATGGSSKASGEYSTAMGSVATASASGAVAIGSFTIASGINATAIGNSTTASQVEFGVINHILIKKLNFNFTFF